MKWTRTVAAAATAVMMAGMMTACGGSGGAGGSGPTLQSRSLPEKLEGSTIRVLAYDGWQEEHADIRQDLKDWYGVSVEYTVHNWQELKKKLSVDLAANITYDMAPVGADLVMNKLCQPVTQYIDLSDPIFADLKRIADSMTFGGELYGAPSVPNPEVIIYNKDLIENLGYDAPLKLYNEGKWNWDTFKSLATSLSKEKTGGGEKITAFSSWDTRVLLTANDTGLIRWQNEKYALNLADSKLREALNYFKELCTTGAFTSWQGWSGADFQLGNSAMIVDRFGNKTHFVSDLSFNWDFVPVPTGYSGSEDVTPGTVALYGVPVGSTNPSGGAAYAYLFCKQDYDRRKEYLAGYLTPEQIGRFESLYPKITREFDIIGLANTDQLIWDIADGADVTSTLEAYKTKWQSELDTYTAALPK